ncbi:MAG: DUF494 family protein [Deferrisomatales bacterium]|nr:DUF494 family protein [Deferrisomatales bacterium]
MKGRMFEVVAYIAHRYGRTGAAAEDPRELRDELLDAGFEEDDVERGLSWLDRLRGTGTPLLPVQPSGTAVRQPTPEEALKLSPDARGLLLRLEAGGIIDGAMREEVYRKALTLDEPELGADEVRVLVALLLRAAPRTDDRLSALVLAGDLAAIYH